MKKETENLDNNSLSLKCFLNMLKESSDNGKRFCFILGSGVSKSSGIPTGIELSKAWIKEIEELYNEKEIEDLKKKLGIEDISIKSENYFDIYNLRFHPDYNNGYSYLEKKMENAKPGFGHYPLARFLTTTENNLVITTNFDSLIEDALFIYTEKRPIVVGHESLAEFIDVSTKRPIIAKLHRGLFFHPLNRSNELQELSEQWKKVLKMVFRIFTPIVIGYGGGDRTLMEFLKDESVELNGIYWCYVGGRPSDDIIKLVKNKSGYFVPIAGFDEMMFMLARKFQYESPNEKIRKVAEERAELYDREFEEFSRKMEEIIEPTEEQRDVKDSLGNYADREKAALLELIEKEPTAENYFKLGNNERINENYDKAIECYEKAIELNPEYAMAYNNRGYSYNKLGEEEKAIEDYSKAIEINPEYALAYSNRGISYSNKGEEEKAMEDYNNAIELNPEYVRAYNNRGYSYSNMGEEEKAIEDYNKAIELNPEYAMAYNNRGISYRNIGEEEKAIEDYKKAIELNPEYAMAYNNRGNSYSNLGEKEKAIRDYNKAIELNPKYALAYNNRGILYENMGEKEKAKKDFKKAAELDPKYKK